MNRGSRGRRTSGGQHDRQFWGAARYAAEAVFEALTPAVQSAMVRVALWRGAHRGNAEGWEIVESRIVVEREGERRFLHEFDIEDVWSIVLTHSDHARFWEESARLAIKQKHPPAIDADA